MKFNNSNYFNLFLYFSFITSLFVGIFLRIYNLGYDNLWFDEIVTFWVSDPSISLYESFQRNSSTEATPFFYNFIVSVINKIFSYNPLNQRYVSSFFGILSVLAFPFLLRLFSKNNSSLFATILISLNVYLIMYSTEGRTYSLLFFISILTIFAFIKILHKIKEQKQFKKYAFLYLSLQILSLTIHPFSLIILFSIIFFVIGRLIFLRKKNLFLNFIIIFFFFFTIIYLILFYKLALIGLADWVKHPDLKFFTNLYFSKFFGSRLLGLAHLLTFTYLIINFRKEILFSLNEKTLLFLIFIFSYLIPIVLGFVSSPVLVDRYIIFVLIPIIVLLSHLVFMIKKIYLRNFIIVTAILLNFGNHFTETNFKQFYEVRQKHKPDFTSALKKISKSKTKNLAFNTSFITEEKNQLTFNNVLGNYANFISNQNKFELNTIKNISLNNLREEQIWIICMLDIMGTNCDWDNTNIQKNYKVLQKHHFIGLQIKLLKKK